MEDDRFAWDDTKAKRNLKDHRMSFEIARTAFDDPNAIDNLDDREDYDEERINRIASIDGVVVFVTFVLRDERIRIISARGANKREQTEYFENLG